MRKGGQQKPPAIDEPKVRSNGKISKWTDETKAEAISLMVSSGLNYNEVEKRTGVSRQTLARWFGEIGPEVFAMASAGRKTLEERIEELAHENMLTLTEFARLSRDPEWFKKQNAHDIAYLAGVMTDKTVRIVQVLQAAQMRRAMAALPGE